MSEIKITAEPRTDFGKGYARRIRPELQHIDLLFVD